jgi:hypothetical protein
MFRVHYVQIHNIRCINIVNHYLVLSFLCRSGCHLQLYTREGNIGTKENYILRFYFVIIDVPKFSCYSLQICVDHSCFFVFYIILGAPNIVRIVCVGCCNPRCPKYLKVDAWDDSMIFGYLLVNI